MIRALLRKLIAREDIGFGYMTRWRLLRTPWFVMYLHHFYGDDNDRRPHDHPKDFASIGLWGSYTEEVHGPGIRELTVIRRVRRWNAPWFRRFPAEHIHRIRSPKNCWTVCIAGRARKGWKFFNDETDASDMIPYGLEHYRRNRAS